MKAKNQFRNKKNEDDPLLDDDQIIFDKNTRGSILQFDNPIFEDEDDVSIAERPMDEIREQMKMREESHPERSLMILDIVYHIIEYFQFYALLQSLSLRWTWPLSWTSSLSFMFLFNLDFWEFLKLTSGSYIAARDYIVPSSDVPLVYRSWFIGWMILLLVIVSAFFIAHLYLRRREVSRAISAGTMLQKVLIGVVQILALPLGVQLGKVFWCNPGTNVMNVANEIQCWSSEHIVYVVISLVVLLLVFPLYALKLYLQIKSQVVTFSQRRHEAYLQLKDCEYRFGLDTAWSSRMFIIFASYRRAWVYTRPIVHLIKFVVICFYAGLFHFRLPQISLITAIFFVLIFLCVFPRQYRVSSYNALALWCWAALCGNAVTGVLLNIDGLESAFITPDYVQGELLLANLGWLFGVLAWLIYVLLRAKGVICASIPLWPTMMSREIEKLPENTKRYMLAALQARFTIQRATIVPPLLSPVHELAHHIHIINALACEAEYLKDPLHSSLRDVLDDLIELHGRISPQSLFSESLKPSVHSTVHELLKVLPDFTRRLKQREYDFILTSPLRRRLLLKIFVVSCFLSKKRCEGDATGGEVGRGAPSAVLRRLWKPPSTNGDSVKIDDISDEGFVGDELDEDNDTFQNEMWYEEDDKQASVVISPTPEKEESVI